jgi:hypothetical protein
MRETVMLLIATALICCSLTIIAELLQNDVLRNVLTFITIFIFVISIALIMIDMLLL